MALLTPEQAHLLTARGFYDRFVKYTRIGMTREEAYNEVENDVRLITGSARYGDFTSFDRTARRINKQEAKGVTNLTNCTSPVHRMMF